MPTTVPSVTHYHPNFICNLGIAGIRSQLLSEWEKGDIASNSNDSDSHFTIISNLFWSTYDDTYGLAPGFQMAEGKEEMKPRWKANPAQSGIAEIRNWRHFRWSAEVRTDVTSVGQWKYVFDVTSSGQRSSPWSCNSVRVEIKFLLKCKLRFPCAQFMLRQCIYELICKYRGWVLSFLPKFWRWLKFELTARQKSVFPWCPAIHLWN